MRQLERTGEILEQGLDALEQRTAGATGRLFMGIGLGIAVTIGGIAVFLLVLAFLVEVFA